jgi:hypothetical protein
MNGHFRTRARLQWRHSTFVGVRLASVSAGKLAV